MRPAQPRPLFTSTPLHRPRALRPTPHGRAFQPISTGARPRVLSVPSLAFVVARDTTLTSARLPALPLVLLHVSLASMYTQN